MTHLRLAVRRLLQQPAFSVLAVVLLAVGLGASAAIVSIVDAVLLRPLPYAQPDRLLAVDHAAPGLDLGQLGMSRRLYVHYREHAESFVDFGLYDVDPVSISGLERPFEVPGAAITPSVLPLLGVAPAHGRAFVEEEGMPGGPPVAIVSDAFWRRHLGADPEVLYRSLEIDGVTRRIVGVMAPGFDFPAAEAAVWTPLAVDPAAAQLGRFGVLGIGRLRDGVGIEQARADLMRFAGDLQGTFPDDRAARVLGPADFGVVLRPLAEAVVGDVAPVLWLVLATVALVLLLAAVTIATLVLARAEERRRETAIRSALGAGRGALAAAWLVEGLLLAALAGGLGLALARLGLGPLLALAPERLPRLAEVAIDGRTAAVVAALAAVCGAVFGLIPILRTRLSRLSAQLQDGGRGGGAGRRRHRSRRTLVAAQMAIAVLLLVGAGLMLQSYRRLTAVDPGFRTDGTVSFRIALPAGRAARDTDVAGFYGRLLERLAALPGVAAAASADGVPLAGGSREIGHRMKDQVDRGEGAIPTLFSVVNVSPDYFRTLGIPMVEGRGIERRDVEQRSGAVVVSETLARRHWPGESALGKRIFPGTPDDDDGWYQVVGVAADVRSLALTEPPPLTVYYPWLGKAEDAWVPRAQTVVLRLASGDPRALSAPAREAVWALDPDLPVASEQTLEQLVRGHRARLAFTALLLSIAAGVAVVLGAVGTYGVISYLTFQRAGEIGVRMALGARRAGVLAMVLREGLALAAAGVAVGLLAAAGLSRLLGAVLFEVGAHDPLTFAAVPLALLAVAVAASLLPARWAAGIDPATALRHQ